MAQSDIPGGGTLQFDRVVNEPGGAAPPPIPTVFCAGCKTAIKTQYYDVNGTSLCGACRASVAAAAETPRGLPTLLLAAALGLGAGIVGAGIYYAVIAIAHLEIGIVAILIGYMVGYSVRRGAGGRGGRRFQVLAAALTYLSVALAYTPMAIQQARAASRQKPAAAVSTAAPSPTEGIVTAARARPRAIRFAIGVAVLLGLTIALPVLVVIGSLPSGLISGFIIFIGIRQAWKMTQAPVLKVHGPYRVGVPQPATS